MANHCGVFHSSSSSFRSRHDHHRETSPSDSLRRGNCRWSIGIAAFATLCVNEAVADRSNAPDTAKYSLKVPGGLAFAEFKGYEDWAVITIDHTGDLMKVILGNPVAMDAFRAGMPL